MGDNDGQKVSGFLGVFVLLFGLYFLISGAITYSRDDPEMIVGSLRPFEQTYVCPGISSRGQVFYEGGLNLIATLTNGLSEVSNTYNKSSFKNNGGIIQASERTFVSFYLIQGSTLKWSVNAIGVSAPEFYLYKKHYHIPCFGEDCGPIASSKGISIFSDSQIVSDDGLYVIELYNSGDTLITLDYSFEVLHTRYNVEDFQIEQAKGSATFTLPKEGNLTYGCVFVENPIKDSDPEGFSLSYYLNKNEKRSILILDIAFGSVVFVIGIILIIVAITCSC